MAGNRPDPSELRLRPAPAAPGGSENILAAPLRDGETCGAFAIRIARDGTWFYHGSPIGRKPLVKLFSSVLRRQADGSYWLITPVEQGRIEVEDAPFTAIELTASGEGHAQRLVFRTNLDDEVIAGPDHPIRVEPDPLRPDSFGAAPAPYIMVRDGLEARLVRAVYYQLVDLGREEVIDGQRVLGVWSETCFFPLGRIEAD